jgi:hypothetical protein
MEFQFKNVESSFSEFKKSSNFSEGQDLVNNSKPFGIILDENLIPNDLSQKKFKIFPDKLTKPESDLTKIYKELTRFKPISPRMSSLIQFLQKKSKKTQPGAKCIMKKLNDNWLLCLEAVEYKKKSEQINNIFSNTKIKEFLTIYSDFENFSKKSRIRINYPISEVKLSWDKQLLYVASNYNQHFFYRLVQTESKTFFKELFIDFPSMVTKVMFFESMGQTNLVAQGVNNQIYFVDLNTMNIGQLQSLNSVILDSAMLDKNYLVLLLGDFSLVLIDPAKSCILERIQLEICMDKVNQVFNLKSKKIIFVYI